MEKALFVWYLKTVHVGRSLLCFHFLGAVGGKCWWPLVVEVELTFNQRGMRERDGPKVNLHATGAMASILGGCQPHQSFQQKQKCYDVTSLTGHWCVFFPCFNLLKTCICKCHLWVDTVRKSGRSRFPQKFTLNLKVMDRGWRDHGWAESVYYPGNNQKIGETRMLLDRNFGFTYIQLQYMHIYTFRGVKDVKVSFCSRLGNGYPYVSFFFVVFFYFFLQGFLTQRPKGLISWSSQNTFKCEMFGENTWGSGVRSGSGCQQDDADTHQVGSKTCDQLLPWRIILGQICVSRWRCCRSWNRLLWDLQFFATSPTLILRCFFATGSLVLNSGSHFLGALRARSIRWDGASTWELLHIYQIPLAVSYLFHQSQLAGPNETQGFLLDPSELMRLLPMIPEQF